MVFPSRGQIFKGSVDRVKDTVARPSLDTFYQVNFSFGNWQTWLGSDVGKKRTQGTDFMQKMSLLCTQAEIPGTSFVPSTAVGHFQGIQEEFPNLRNFPPLNLVFYCDADHVIIEVLETWMSFINPIQNGSKNPVAYSRFNYPEEYKETLHITKFERDTFIRESRAASYQSDMTSYEFVNIWPSNLTSMRVAYGDSNVLRCTVQLTYDRFFTNFNYEDIRKQVVNNPVGIVNSKEIVAANTVVDPAAVEGGYTISRKNLSTSQNVRIDNARYGDSAPPGAFGIGSKSTDNLNPRYAQDGNNAL